MLAGKLCSRHAAMPIKHLQCSVPADSIAAHAGGYKGTLQAGQHRHPHLLKRDEWQLVCQKRTAPQESSGVVQTHGEKALAGLVQGGLCSRLGCLLQVSIPERAHGDVSIFHGAPGATVSSCSIAQLPRLAPAAC